MFGKWFWWMRCVVGGFGKQFLGVVHVFVWMWCVVGCFGRKFQTGMWVCVILQVAESGLFPWWLL